MFIVEIVPSQKNKLGDGMLQPTELMESNEL
jgi:hypothetical protein